MRFALIAAFALALGACAQPTPTPTPGPSPSPTPAPAPVANNPLQQLNAFTIADLQAASADAHAQPDGPGCAKGTGDCTAWPCYDALAGLVATLPTSVPNQTVGVALAFQKGRDLVNGVSGVAGPLASLNRACAPLVIDTQTLLNKLLLLGAGAAGTGGLIP